MAEITNLSFIQPMGRSRCTAMRFPIRSVGKPSECISVQALAREMPDTAAA